MSTSEDSKLVEYLYGELSPEETEKMEVHLKSEPVEAETLNELRGVLGALREADEDPSPHLDALILARAREVAAARIETAKPWWKKLFFGTPVLGLATAGALVVAMFFIVQPRAFRPAREPSGELATAPASSTLQKTGDIAQETPAAELPEPVATPASPSPPDLRLGASFKDRRPAAPRTEGAEFADEPWDAIKPKEHESRDESRAKSTQKLEASREADAKSAKPKLDEISSRALGGADEGLKRSEQPVPARVASVEDKDRDKNEEVAAVVEHQAPGAAKKSGSIGDAAGAPFSQPEVAAQSARPSEKSAPAQERTVPDPAPPAPSALSAPPATAGPSDGREEALARVAAEAVSVARTWQAHKDINRARATLIEALRRVASSTNAKAMVALALGRLEAEERRYKEARLYLRQATLSSDPGVSQAARVLLAELRGEGE